MAPLLLLNADDVRALIDLPSLFEPLEHALVELSRGTTSVPPRTVARAPGGFLGSMPGYVPGTALEAKLVAVFSGNHDRGLPSHQALIALFDEETGMPLCVMDGTVVTAVRTGATSAVAARALARPEVRTLAILGAGVQGRSHLNAFTTMFDPSEIRIASRKPDHARTLAAADPRARATGFEEAVRGADVVCCCTDADEPVIAREWLSPGAHVSSVGVGAEVDEATVRDASVFVEWRGAAENPPPTGSAELQGLDSSTLVEIGEVLGGDHPGRRSDDELTLYKSTGHAVEDAAAARQVFDRAVADGRGQTFEL
ncbi:MAG TPA: ornithine cyclodeaminase family protein [Actinomycetota bacterium]|nr:ornithine cyclodeaminase family protein [Actinomycetota bacterium]